MPLTPYKRGDTWWVKGRIEDNGLAITDYLRESTGASTESGARDWIAQRTEREKRRRFLGEEHSLTFADAVMLYPTDANTAKYLIPIVARLGALPVASITAQMIRELGRELYPNNAADTWRRWVVTPARAVINYAHDLGKCPPIRIKGYDKAERIKQDKKRGKKSRQAKTPGSWEWLLKFRQHANRRNRALALLMFVTGARISQAIAMHPDRHLLLDEGKVIIPGAKGHEDRTLTIPPELVAELKDLPVYYPRGWDRRYKDNRRLFGYASKDGPRKNWITACKRAGIPYLPPHSAGRHGFGQEMNVRQPIDEKAAGEFGGWSDLALMKRTYTHSEDHEAKVLASFRTGLVQAEKETGLKLAETL
ncbi:MAG TPA: site-specific integrase [Sphingomonas sp.]